jgi:hypothetical protein
MADFQLKAYSSWYDVFNSYWEVEIYQDLDLVEPGGESPISIVPFICDHDPLVFRLGTSGNLDTVIKATECTVNIVIPNGENFDWLFSDFSPRKFKLKVILDSNTYFWGYMINDQFYDDLSYNRKITPIFSDQLNLLTNEDYLDGSYGPITSETLLNQLCTALAATGLQLNINIACNIYHFDMQIGDEYDPFNQAWLSQSIWLDENFNPGKCSTVIEEILKGFWCRIFQSEGEWWICRVRDLEKVTIPYRKFSYNGALITYGNLTPQLQTSTSLSKQTPLIQRIFGGELEYYPDWKYRDLEVDYGLKPSLVSGLNVDILWIDPITHARWTNVGDKWYHIGYTVDGVNKGFIKCSTDDRLEIVGSIYSPFVNIYTVNTYTFTVLCGRNNSTLLNYCYVQLALFVGGVATYWYDDTTGEWEDDGLSVLRRIHAISFEVVSDLSNIGGSLISQNVEVAAPPVDGLLRIIFYTPYKSLSISPNTNFYIGNVSFEISNEDENIPNGEVSRVNIVDSTGDTQYVPEMYQIKFNGGIVSREIDTPGTFVQITTDKYYGLLALTADLASVVDEWVEIYDTDSDGIRKLKDWLLYHWKRHYSSISKTYEGSFRGSAIRPTTVLKVMEFVDAEYGQLYIWDDVEFHARTGIWTGTWLNLKTKNTLKTGQTFKSVLRAYAINTNLATSIGGIGVSSSNDDSYRSNEESISAGEQTILYLKPFAEDDEDLITLDPAIMGITAEGEILWAVPYWDSTIEKWNGFKISFGVDVTIIYTARLKK